MGESQSVPAVGPHVVPLSRRQVSGVGHDPVELHGQLGVAWPVRHPHLHLVHAQVRLGGVLDCQTDRYHIIIIIVITTTTIIIAFTKTLSTETILTTHTHTRTHARTHARTHERTHARTHRHLHTRAFRVYKA